MRLLTIFAALTAVVAASPLNAAGEIVYRTDVQGPPSASANATGNVYDGTQANGVKILPRFANTPPKDGATRTTIKYGSYSVSKASMMSTFKVSYGGCQVLIHVLTVLRSSSRALVRGLVATSPRWKQPFASLMVAKPTLSTAHGSITSPCSDPEEVKVRFGQLETSVQLSVSTPNLSMDWTSPRCTCS